MADADFPVPGPQGPPGKNGSGGGGSIEPPDWHDFALLNGASAFGAPYEVPGWAITALGGVIMRGLLQPVTDDFPVPYHFATLPDAEAFPQKRKLSICADANDPQAPGAVILIEPNGEVKMFSADDNCLASLDDVAYDLQASV